MTFRYLSALGFGFSWLIVSCVADGHVLLRAGRVRSFCLLQLLNLCEAEDSALTKLPCYKSLPSLVPLRIAALSEFI